MSRNCAVLYGCGDFLTDYEGTSGYEHFRGDIAVMYLLDLTRSCELLSVQLVPMHMRRFRLERVSLADAEWLCSLLNELVAPFGNQVRLTDDHGILLV